MTSISSDHEPLIICICPLCRKTHEKEIRWVGGNVVPRVYCTSCRVSVNQLSGDGDIETHTLKKVVIDKKIPEN